MNNMKNFKDLDIWKVGIDLAKDLHIHTRHFPDEEKLGLVAHMRKAAISIPSYIAEGCSKTTDIEFQKFIELSIGASFELETQVIICEYIGFLDIEILNLLSGKIKDFQIRAASFVHELKRLR